MNLTVCLFDFGTSSQVLFISFRFFGFDFTAEFKNRYSLLICTLLSHGTPSSLVKGFARSPKTNGNGNGHLALMGKSRPKKDGSHNQTQHIIFNPNKYMLKLPKTKKTKLSNGKIKWEQIEADYLPVAARIMWFRREHPDWSIITKAHQLAEKGIVMKAVIKNAEGRVTPTASKKETEIGFQDYIEKAETGAI